MEHVQFLQQALSLAWQGRGSCAPNPAVGAVLVSQGKIIGEGFHQGAGLAHAEVNALRGFDSVPADATLYVTLEPCCHHGRTPPCTDLIMALGIKQVVFAELDPNPIVAGKGQAILQQHGIACHHISYQPISDFYQSYAYWLRHKTPFLTAKLALSLDGKIAHAEGKPAAITGDTLQGFTHQQRKITDAIMTSSRTILADNPKLNARIDNINYAKKLILLDSTCRVPATSTVFQTASQVIIFHDKNHSPAKPIPTAQYYAVDREIQGLDMTAILARLGQIGIHDLWLEAGGQCFNTFLNAKLLNRVYLYVSLKTLGADAIPAFVRKSEILQTAKSVCWQQMGLDVMAKINL